MDVGLEHAGGAALEIERKIVAAGPPERMRHPVGLDGVEALEIQQRIDQPRAGRVAVEHRQDVGPERVRDVPFPCHHVGEHLLEQRCRHIGMIEPGGDPLHDGRLEAGLVEHGRQDGFRQLGFAAQNLFGFRPDPAEQGIGVSQADDLGPETMPHRGSPSGSSASVRYGASRTRKPSYACDAYAP